jgi:hypothetical protein
MIDDLQERLERLATELTGTRWSRRPTPSTGGRGGAGGGGSPAPRCSAWRSPAWRRVAPGCSGRTL